MSPNDPLSGKRRDEHQRMENMLAVAVVLFLTVGGSVAIALAYGRRALLLGTICLVIGALIFGLLWGLLTLMEYWLDS